MATCTLSSRPRTTTITAVAAASATSHSVQARQETASVARGVRSLSGWLLPAGSRVELEPISNAGLRHDEARPHGIALNLAADAADVHPQILLHIAVRIAPHRREHL